MTSDFQDRVPVPAEAWQARDQDEMSSFFLASELVIEQLAAAMNDVMPCILGEPARDIGHCDLGVRAPGGCAGESPAWVVLEGWDDAMAARCAILLQRERGR